MYIYIYLFKNHTWSVYLTYRIYIYIQISVYIFLCVSISLSLFVSPFLSMSEKTFPTTLLQVDTVCQPTEFICCVGIC